ncbi:MAG: class I SAM-dependent methyltransferase [Thermoflexibacteraceae bacterium]|jgi:predicted SAM-dependent methyltransferase
MKFTTKIAYSLLPSYVWTAILKEWKLRKFGKQIKSYANQQKLQQIKKQSNLNLHIGCGKRIMPNWVNIDIFQGQQIDLQLDFRQPLPFDDNSVTMIYSEHVLEHIFKEDALVLLKEFHRVLKKGGIARIGVPDAEIYFKAYINKDRDFFAKLKRLGGAVIPLDTPIDVINQMFRMGGDHLFAWDFETLSKGLKEAGFENITKWDSCKASSTEICLDDPEHEFETLYVEVVK